MTIEQTQTATVTSLVTSVATATMTETETDTVTYTQISTDIQPTTVTSVWWETQTIDNVSFGVTRNRWGLLFNDARHRLRPLFRVTPRRKHTT